MSEAMEKYLIDIAIQTDSAFKSAQIIESRFEEVKDKIASGLKQAIKTGLSVPKNITFASKLEILNKEKISSVRDSAQTHANSLSPIKFKTSIDRVNSVAVKKIVSDANKILRGESLKIGYTLLADKAVNLDSLRDQLSSQIGKISIPLSFKLPGSEDLTAFLSKIESISSQLKSATNIPVKFELPKTGSPGKFDEGTLRSVVKELKDKFDTIFKSKANSDKALQFQVQVGVQNTSLDLIRTQIMSALSKPFDISVNVSNQKENVKKKSPKSGTGEPGVQFSRQFSRQPFSDPRLPAGVDTTDIAIREIEDRIAMGILKHRDPSKIRNLARGGNESVGVIRNLASKGQVGGIDFSNITQMIITDLQEAVAPKGRRVPVQLPGVSGFSWNDTQSGRRGSVINKIPDGIKGGKFNPNQLGFLSTVFHEIMHTLERTIEEQFNPTSLNKVFGRKGLVTRQGVFKALGKTATDLDDLFYQSVEDKAEKLNKVQSTYLKNYLSGSGAKADVTAAKLTGNNSGLKPLSRLTSAAVKVGDEAITEIMEAIQIAREKKFRDEVTSGSAPAAITANLTKMGLDKKTLLTQINPAKDYELLSKLSSDFATVDFGNIQDPSERKEFTRIFNELSNSTNSSLAKVLSGISASNFTQLIGKQIDISSDPATSKAFNDLVATVGEAAIKQTMLSPALARTLGGRQRVDTALGDLGMGAPVKGFGSGAGVQGAQALQQAFGGLALPLIKSERDRLEDLTKRNNAGVQLTEDENRERIGLVGRSGQLTFGNDFGRAMVDLLDNAALNSRLSNSKNITSGLIGGDAKVLGLIAKSSGLSDNILSLEALQSSMNRMLNKVSGNPMPKMGIYSTDPDSDPASARGLVSRLFGSKPQSPDDPGVGGRGIFSSTEGMMRIVNAISLIEKNRHQLNKGLEQVGEELEDNAKQARMFQAAMTGVKQEALDVLNLLQQLDQRLASGAIAPLSVSQQSAKQDMEKNAKDAIAAADTQLKKRESASAAKEALALRIFRNDNTLDQGVGTDLLAQATGRSRGQFEEARNRYKNLKINEKLLPFLTGKDDVQTIGKFNQYTTGLGALANDPTSTDDQKKAALQELSNIKRKLRLKEALRIREEQGNLADRDFFSRNLDKVSQGGGFNVPGLGIDVDTSRINVDGIGGVGKNAADIDKEQKSIQEYSAAWVGAKEKMEEARKASLLLGTTQVAHNRITSALTGQVLIDEKVMYRYGQQVGDVVNNLQEGAVFTQRFGGELLTAARKVAQWGVATAIVYGTIRRFREMRMVLSEVDLQLAKTRQVLNPATADFQTLEKSAGNIASKYGESFANTLAIVAEFSRQGFNLTETLKATDKALLLSNVSTLSAADAGKALTAIVRQMNISLDDLSPKIDILSAVAAGFAVEAGDLTAGLARSGKAAQNVGLSFSDLTSIIATVGEATQRTGREVGNSYRTIFARSISRNSIRNFRELGIEIVNASGEIKPFGDLIDEIGGKWNNLTKAQRANLAETLGGKTRYNDVLALFDNYNRYLEAQTIAENSVGDARVKNQEVMKSYSKIVAQMRTEFEKLAITVSRGGLLDLLTLFTKIIGAAASGLNSLDQSVGGLGSTLLTSTALTTFGVGATALAGRQFGFFQGAQKSSVLDLFNDPAQFAQVLTKGLGSGGAAGLANSSTNNIISGSISNAVGQAVAQGIQTAGPGGAFASAKANLSNNPVVGMMNGVSSANLGDLLILQALQNFDVGKMERRGKAREVFSKFREGLDQFRGRNSSSLASQRALLLSQRDSGNYLTGGLRKSGPGQFSEVIPYGLLVAGDKLKDIFQGIAKVAGSRLGRGASGAAVMSSTAYLTDSGSMSNIVGNLLGGGLLASSIFPGTMGKAFGGLKGLGGKMMNSGLGKAAGALGSGLGGSLLGSGAAGAIGSVVSFAAPILAASAALAALYFTYKQLTKTSRDQFEMEKDKVQLYKKQEEALLGIAARTTGIQAEKSNGILSFRPKTSKELLGGTITSGEINQLLAGSAGIKGLNLQLIKKEMDGKLVLQFRDVAGAVDNVSSTFEYLNQVIKKLDDKKIQQQILALGEFEDLGMFSDKRVGIFGQTLSFSNSSARNIFEAVEKDDFKNLALYLDQAKTTLELFRAELGEIVNNPNFDLTESLADDKKFKKRLETFGEIAAGVALDVSKKTSEDRGIFGLQQLLGRKLALNGTIRLSDSGIIEDDTLQKFSENVSTTLDSGEQQSNYKNVFFAFGKIKEATTEVLTESSNLREELVNRLTPGMIGLYDATGNQDFRLVSLSKNTSGQIIAQDGWNSTIINTQEELSRLVVFTSSLTQELNDQDLILGRIISKLGNYADSLENLSKVGQAFSGIGLFQGQRNDLVNQLRGNLPQGLSTLQSSSDILNERSKGVLDNIFGSYNAGFDFTKFSTEISRQRASIESLLLPLEALKETGRQIASNTDGNPNRSDFVNIFRNFSNLSQSKIESFQEFSNRNRGRGPVSDNLINTFDKYLKAQQARGIAYGLASAVNLPDFQNKSEDFIKRISLGQASATLGFELPKNIDRSVTFESILSELDLTADDLANLNPVGSTGFRNVLSTIDTKVIPDITREVEKAVSAFENLQKQSLEIQQSYGKQIQDIGASFKFDVFADSASGKLELLKDVTEQAVDAALRLGDIPLARNFIEAANAALQINQNIAQAANEMAKLSIKAESGLSDPGTIYSEALKQNQDVLTRLYEDKRIATDAIQDKGGSLNANAQDVKLLADINDKISKIERNEGFSRGQNGRLVLGTLLEDLQVLKNEKGGESIQSIQGKILEQALIDNLTSLNNQSDPSTIIASISSAAAKIEEILNEASAADTREEFISILKKVKGTDLLSGVDPSAQAAFGGSVPAQLEALVRRISPFGQDQNIQAVSFVDQLTSALKNLKIDVVEAELLNAKINRASFILEASNRLDGSRDYSSRLGFDFLRKLAKEQGGNLDQAGLIEEFKRAGISDEKAKELTNTLLQVSSLELTGTAQEALNKYFSDAINKAFVDVAVGNNSFERSLGALSPEEIAGKYQSSGLLDRSLNFFSRNDEENNRYGHQYQTLSSMQDSLVNYLKQYANINQLFQDKTEDDKEILFRAVSLIAPSQLENRSNILNDDSSSEMLLPNKIGEGYKNTSGKKLDDFVDTNITTFEKLIQGIRDEQLKASLSQNLNFFKEFSPGEKQLSDGESKNAFDQFNSLVSGIFNANENLGAFNQLADARSSVSEFSEIIQPLLSDSVSNGEELVRLVTDISAKMQNVEIITPPKNHSGALYSSSSSGLKNDEFYAILQRGEAVIPRHLVNSLPSHIVSNLPKFHDGALTTPSYVNRYGALPPEFSSMFQSLASLVADFSRIISDGGDNEAIIDAVNTQTQMLGTLVSQMSQMIAALNKPNNSSSDLMNGLGKIAEALNKNANANSNVNVLVAPAPGASMQHKFEVSLRKNEKEELANLVLRQLLQQPEMLLKLVTQHSTGE